jgi:hypothetical protein
MSGQAAWAGAGNGVLAIDARAVARALPEKCDAVFRSAARPEISGHSKPQQNERWANHRAQRGHIQKLGTDRRLRWFRSFGRNFRLDKWIVCQG